jgi:hypothetical protein
VFRIGGQSRPWWALVGACSGPFILMLDSTMVALALFSIRDDVGADGERLMTGGMLCGVAVTSADGPESHREATKSAHRRPETLNCGLR